MSISNEIQWAMQCNEHAMQWAMKCNEMQWAYNEVQCNAMSILLAADQHRFHISNCSHRQLVWREAQRPFAHQRGPRRGDLGWAKPRLISKLKKNWSQKGKTPGDLYFPFGGRTDKAITGFKEQKVHSVHFLNFSTDSRTRFIRHL